MAESKPANTLSSFGESPSKSLTSKSVQGSQRQLVLTEVTRTGDTLTPTGVEFRFTRDNFSAPRGPQEFGLVLRTSKKQLPGSEEPVEQVLGWNYEDFQVTGVWDDRHGGAGFAEKTRRDFEQLVKRGNPVQYQFEEVAMLGLVTKFVTRYVRKELQTYSFVISPHNRYLGETVRVDPNKTQKISTDPKTAVKRARAGADALSAAQDAARGKSNSRVQQLLKSGVFSDINDTISTISGHITKAEKLVQDELLGPQANATTALHRGAQTLVSARTAVATLLSQQASLTASAHMSVSTFVENLKYETWHRTLAGSARIFTVTLEQSRRDFDLRARSKPKTLHRVREGESLYQISNKYYGTPHHWREILAANKLSSLVLSGGELLEIPEVKR